MMENEEEQKVTKRCKYQFQPQIADESCDDCKVAANCEVKPNTMYEIQKTYGNEHYDYSELTQYL